jgi:hypothetical protein
VDDTCRIGLVAVPSETDRERDSFVELELEPKDVMDINAADPPNAESALLAVVEMVEQQLSNEAALERMDLSVPICGWW